MEKKYGFKTTLRFLPDMVGLSLMFYDFVNCAGVMLIVGPIHMGVFYHWRSDQ